MLRTLALLALTIPLTSCAATRAYVTDAPASTEAVDTLCQKLQEERPTYSTRDTYETLEQGARFLSRLDALCPR